MTIKEIISNAGKRLNVEQLTPMQHKMAGLPPETPAVALIAPTGSGKTLAFALALLPRVKGSTGHIEALVIAPTRELVLQITKTLASLAPDMRIVALYGGHSVLDETRSLEAAVPDVVVGTPGRILDHIGRGRLDLYRVKVLATDEYDKSLELGFQDEMRRIVRKIHAPQLLILTSATRLDELPDWLPARGLQTLDFTNGCAEQPKLKEYAVASADADKLDTLKNLLLRLLQERTIVFVNHRESAERVYDFLKNAGFPAALYHGALDQHDRETAVDIFSNGSTPIMVASDLAARGLDIPQVRNVVHYHLPLTDEILTHRNGRSGRMGAEGNVYYLIGPKEEAPAGVGPISFAHVEPQQWARPCRTLYFHSGRKEKLSKGDIVGALTGPGGLAAKQIGPIALHDHRALVAITDADTAALAQTLSAGRIKGKKVRVTPLN